MDKAIKKRIEQIARGEAPEGYEKTAFGIFPGDWGKHKIAEIFEIYSGGTPDTTQVKYWDGDIPWCVPTDITGCGKYIAHTARNITQLGLSNSAAILIPSGSILMCSRATIGPRCINIIPMATNQGFKNLVCKENNSIEFFYYYLDILLKQFLKNSSGSTFLELAKGVLSQQLCVIPNEKEQEKIAEILQTQDRLIELKENLIAEKYKPKQYLMDVLLTGKVRLPGFSDDWERVELKDICEIRRGSTIIKSQIVYGSIPVIAGGKEPAYYHNEANRKANVITVSASGASAGYVAFYKTPIFASDCSTIDEVKNSDLRFIYYSLCLRQDELYNLQSGGAQPHVYPKQLGKMVIYKPSLLEQSAIADILSVSDSEIDALKEELILQRKQRDALMQLLLTGIVRVKYE